MPRTFILYGHQLLTSGAKLESYSIAEKIDEENRIGARTGGRTINELIENIKGNQDFRLHMGDKITTLASDEAEVDSQGRIYQMKVKVSTDELAYFCRRVSGAL